MREFESTFEEGLKKGLRREEFSPAKEQQLVECWNLRPQPTGLQPIVSITNPFDETISWPWPQVMAGMNFRLLADETEIYTCDGSWATTSVIDTLTTGDCWDWADFGDFILMTNGSQIVQRYGFTGVWSSFASTAAIPAMKTICNFKGQVIAGNISSWHDCDSNYVAWSDIGSATFEPESLKNEAGYAIMPFNGEVLRVLPLGDVVIIYCENGVAVMKPAKQYFGIAELLPVGIPWKGAVGSSDKGHTFVDYNGELWFLGSDLKPKKLGYQEYISTLSAGDIMISCNDGENEYYISDGTYCFLLTRQGLCQVHQLPTSVAFIDGQLTGVFTAGSDLTGRAVTDILDFGIRSFKTISALELGIQSSSSVQACVDWRSDINGTFQRSTWLESNPTGFVTPIVTANDFRLCVRSSSYSDMQLRHIVARVKNVDRRAMRGVPVRGAGLRR